jgi:hypothetical protein
MHPSYAMTGPLLLVAALALPGCWSAPIARLQSKGTPGPIQGAIVFTAESVMPPAVVQSVDLATRAITVLPSGEATQISYKVDLSVSNFERLKAGDRVQSTVAEQLTVYVRRDGAPPGARGLPQTIVTDAQVLSIEPSYRLMTLHFPDGRDETLKVSRQVKLDEVETGDEVSIRPVEAIAVRMKK